MFAGLRRSMPLWPAAIISGVVFGSLHLTGGQRRRRDPALGLRRDPRLDLYERSGTLWAPIMPTRVNNTIAFTLLLTT